MSIHHLIIIEPLITERNSILQTEGKFAFKVAVNATKSEIKDAVEEIFKAKKIKVLSVNTMNYSGKKKRVGRYLGSRPDWKKAIVKIENGKDLDLFNEI
ncbi:MAG: 50S ribosomal protein L23 [Chitinispirillales bacterium]|jgi:large subunit ribosomal protein L23|nr:50S ribosomal protein L23 [Chitinispirillales bacterium]